DFQHVLELHIVGHGTDWALAGLTGAEAHFSPIGENGAAPAARAEGRDRRQGQQRRLDGQDGAVGGEVVGGGACRGGKQYAVADELIQAYFIVDDDLDLGGLVGGAEQRDLVECQSLLPPAGGVEHLHRQG